MAEQRIPLSDETLTAAGCDHPERALDDDAATNAVFGAPSVVLVGPGPRPMDTVDEVLDNEVMEWDTVVNTNPQPGATHSSEFEVVDLSRFLRATWTENRFVTRIRAKVGGAGADDAGIALIEGSGETPVLLSPFPDGDGYVSATFDPPILASGVAFYPDALLDTTGFTPGDYPTVLLTQLDAFEYVQEGNPPMPNPTSKRSRVGVQEVKIYPYNGVTGPYDGTTECQLLGLNQLGLDVASKSAVVTGGETVHALGAHETERMTKIKVTSAICDLRTMQVLLGGAFAVDAASGNLGEVQYHTQNIDDRAPYFRLKAKSTVGDGTDSFVYVKCKVDGSVSYNLDKDKVTDLEFSFMIFWDPTYVRQDGATGGIMEWLHGSKGETTRHS